MGRADELEPTPSSPSGELREPEPVNICGS